MNWIKIDRSLLDSYSFANPVTLKIWMWILLKANYKKSYACLKVGKGFTTVEVDRGQLLFGRHSSEKELKIGGQTVYRNLKKLEELGQILIKTNNQYSIITVCKYDSYQLDKKIDEQQMISQRSANDQRMNNERTTNEQRMITSKESKEYTYNIGGTNEENIEYVFCMEKIYEKSWGEYRDCLNGQRKLFTLDEHEDFFIRWKKFVDLVREKYADLLSTKFVSPVDFGKLIREKEFTEEKWDEILEDICGTGVKPEHNLFFRIPQFMDYAKNKKMLGEKYKPKPDFVNPTIKSEKEIDFDKYRSKPKNVVMNKT